MAQRCNTSSFAILNLTLTLILSLTLTPGILASDDAIYCIPSNAVDVLKASISLTLSLTSIPTLNLTPTLDSNIP